MQRNVPLAVVLAGHVDHGKSSVLARLLHELGRLPAAKVDELAALSNKRGVPLEWSFVLDAFQAERDQAITLDTTRVRLATARREFVFIDAPGHHELLKNMVSGASMADAALVVVDAQSGAEEQTLRHAYLLKLLGVEELVVAINKMDSVGYDEAVYRMREHEVLVALQRIGLSARAVVPVSARDGANLNERSVLQSWFAGPTLTLALESLHERSAEDARPLRLVVQDVYRFDDERMIAGRIESGGLRLGDEIVFSPSSRAARVAALRSWPHGDRDALTTGDNASIVLDRPLVVERGDIASHREHAPKLTSVFDADVFWLGAEALARGCELALQLGTREVAAHVQAIRHRLDISTLQPTTATELHAGDVGHITLRTHTLVAIDDFAMLRATGRFVLRDRHVTVGAGIIDATQYPDQRVVRAVKNELTPTRHQVSAAERSVRFGHEGAVVWLTGLSAAGKSTLAMALERRLFDSGYAVFVLDGDNVRSGLNANLGFSPDDRQENIRRIGEVAALFAEAGFICITAFISPYRDDRARARLAARGTRFLEVHVKADLSVCEARDPKGLYKKARAGELHEFTGVDSPYEEPELAELTIDTGSNDITTCVAKLVSFVAAQCRHR